MTVLIKLSVLSVSSAALQIYDHLSSTHTISDQIFANMSRFSIISSHITAHFHNLI
ncbi:hypothetical protein BDFG_09335, partial [Blastomyces dermatitidis ATCC 26199]